MSRNIKVLNDDELNYIKNIYDFNLIDNFVVVKSKSYNRSVAHDINKAFKLNTKVRVFTVTTDAIDFWIKNLDCNLIDVQNSINKLIVTYQDVTTKNILNLLGKEN